MSAYAAASDAAACATHVLVRGRFDGKEFTESRGAVVHGYWREMGVRIRVDSSQFPGFWVSAQLTSKQDIVTLGGRLTSNGPYKVVATVDADAGVVTWREEAGGNPNLFAEVIIPTAIWNQLPDGKPKKKRTSESAAAAEPPKKLKLTKVSKEEYFVQAQVHVDELAFTVPAEKLEQAIETAVEWIISRIRAAENKTEQQVVMAWVCKHELTVPDGMTPMQFIRDWLLAMVLQGSWPDGPNHLQIEDDAWFSVASITHMIE